MKPSEKLTNFTDTELLSFVREQGGQRAAARALDVPRSTLQYHVWKAQEAIRTITAIRAPLIERKPPKGQIKTFIFSSAQDNTPLNERSLRFLGNIEAYAKKLGGEIFISGFTYQKGLFEDHSKSGGQYDQRISPYLMLARMEIADQIAFCGEMNILPTAVRPLSGLETYTRHMWGIIPHPKIALESVATPKFHRSKQIMTTGCITPKNYVPKKAGLKAEFHHTLGALLVEIDEDGDVFCRHLLADTLGDFQDLDVVVTDGKITKGQRVYAINWGDIHIEKIDPVSMKTCWGLELAEPGNWEGNTITHRNQGNMIDTLKPRYQFFHDTSDFTPRNHHNIADPHFRFEMFSRGTDTVRGALYKAARFLHATQRLFTQSVVVESNHDLAYLKWLRTQDYRLDPVNALFFLESQMEVYKAIQRGDIDFSIFEWAMHKLVPETGSCTFLREDDSYFILGDERRGIECAMHGHLGPNGARGSAAAFAKIGPKLNIGHVHSPFIRDGVYAAGIEGDLDQGYNKGPSSWAQAEIVTYPNGRRVLITRNGAKWRAAR